MVRIRKGSVDFFHALIEGIGNKHVIGIVVIECKRVVRDRSVETNIGLNVVLLIQLEYVPISLYFFHHIHIIVIVFDVVNDVSDGIRFVNMFQFILVFDVHAPQIDIFVV
tara:strand:+ start:471 stop:800 length:330 start_codon:yes stop_codon:yes gene_type:complete